MRRVAPDLLPASRMNGGSIESGGAANTDPSLCIQELRAAIAETLSHADPGGPRRVRAVLARLRVWLALGRRRGLVREVRWLRRNAGRVRDVDVLLNQHPPEPLRGRLERRRARRNLRLKKALRSERTDALLEALEREPRLREASALEALGRMARRAWKRALGIQNGDGSAAAIRALRKEVRDLRLGLEWTGGSTGSLRTLQKTLGRVCDRTAALRATHARPRSAEVGAFRRRLRRKRRHASARARATVRVSLPALDALTAAFPVS